MNGTPAIGFVVIGRNEGERLDRCLASVLTHSRDVVYVDSGSTDGSIERARAMGIDVVRLDASRPFTAARGRNAGFRRILELVPETVYVQFLDGDTELRDGWVAQAADFLAANPGVAVVAGRRRERYPERSVYNLLCDLEWDTALGETQACGGDAMVLARAFAASGGFRDELIAGEEPELCLRLRAAGWRVWRLSCDMTLHDANMNHFSQWWRRAYRAGHAFAESAYLHAEKPERPWARESRRSLVWALGVPLAGITATAVFGTTGAVLFALYPLQVVRLACAGRRSTRENWLQALFLVLGKFPEALGQLRFFVSRCLGARSGLIEYK